MYFISTKQKNRTTTILLVLISVIGIPGIVKAQTPVDKISYTLFNDFETGELYSWEPYPYSQDIGFDALYFARQSPTFQNSKYALARPVKANDATELYQGFTRRLNLYTIASTRIKAAIYFQSDRNPQTLKLSLGTFDGRRYLYTIQNPTANKWLEMDIPVTDFKMNGQSLGSGEHIQVITIKASYSMVYYLYTYTILMDNFSINGERLRHFVGVQPATTDFNMFDVTILNKHYFSGDVLSLTTRPEGNTPLTQLKGKLVNSKGKVIKDNIPFLKKAKDWSNESIYRFTTRDVLGQWEILLTGKTQAGTEIRWGFKFLMPGEHVTGHPRLFFSESELRKRISGEKSPVAQRMLDNTLKDTGFMKVDIDALNEGEDMTADNLVGGPYSKIAVGFNAMNLWLGPMSRLGQVIEDGSFHYAFAHDATSGAKAKKALLKLCTFSKLNNNWMLQRKFWTYYPVGYALKSIAYGYDMLYDILSEQERTHVREFIINQGLKPFYRDMVEMNRMPSNMTNHIAVMVTGYGLAAAAIYGDDPGNPFLEPFLSGILTKAKTFIDRTYYADGSYGEPKSGYMNMATRDIVELLATIERNFGVNYSTTTNIENWYKYPLQEMYSGGLMQDYGDGERHSAGLTQAHAEWFVKRTGNPYLYSYVKPYWESGKGGYLGYLWYRDDIKPVSRQTLPVSKVFEAQGIVMRSGWDDSSTVISTRTGPNSNHYHYDQGSFQLMTNGEHLLTDPGIGYLGYYANLDYLIYNIQAIAHNVLLVDHDPESQTPADYDNGIAALRTWPRMIHSFAGKTADESVADLTCVYKDKLSSYNRTLLYTKAGPLFLFDQVKSNSPEGHVYDWLFHAPQNENNKRSISYLNQHVLIDRPDARLSIDVVEPEIASAIVRDRDDKRFPENYIVLSSKPKLSSVNFLAVLFPEAKSATGDMVEEPKVIKLSGQGWIGTRVEHKGNVYFGFFQTGSNASANIEGFTTNARRFTVSLTGNDMLRSLYFEGTSFKFKGMGIQSTEVVTCTFDFQKDAAAIELQSDKATLFSFSSANKPKSILLDGSSLRGWQYNAVNKMVSLKLTEGRHELSIN
jgi:hypothetical protein